ncbi:phospholipase A2 inhibitor-like [Schistocerca americana]|uniref:phospholipase A2 inhibitor-like n=1 Tax=Schistocerca americana TaxID=7009 RepID=UPI001F4FDE9C|nr:phospholipase A2 inhibitor-like [Schistocerca americana]
MYVSELYLDHNRIQYLPVGTLNSFVSTEVVDLSWNQMKNISDKHFSSLRELKRLSLAGNPIGKLNITLPTNLEELDVSSCELSSLGERTLKGLHLKSLDISNNSLVAVDWSLVDNETSVRANSNPWDCSLLWQNKPEFARSQERCATTTGSATTTPVAAEVGPEASTTTEGARVPEELLWSSFGIVEAVLVGWLVYFLLLGSAAWLRARSLHRDLARDGNWWLEPRL